MFPRTERFELRRELGRGGMGIVYVAYDRERETEVALKTISSLNPDSIFRFKREFRSLANVNHPNLVSLYEFMSEQGQWFFTMELLDGVDILTYLREGSAALGNPVAPATRTDSDGSLGETTATALIPPADATSNTVASCSSSPVAAPKRRYAMADEGRIRSALRQLVDGLSALHQSGHLHRDVKPSNVLVTTEGRVVVLDFGVAIELSLLPPTVGEEVAGTPSYMAPEQADLATTTSAADWYSVGVILYEALAGTRPYVGSGRQILHDKRTALPMPPKRVSPDAPADLCDLAMALLSPDPARRPLATAIATVLRRSSEEPAVTIDEPTNDSSFIGRDKEYAALKEAFQSAVAGSGRSIYVSGRSGMGKSLLMSRFLDEVRRQPDTVVLEGRCYQQESVPYKAVDGVVDALCSYLCGMSEMELDAVLPVDAHTLMRVFPVLGRIAAISNTHRGAAATIDPHELKRRAFRALRELLARLAARRKVVVFIDDLQWGDIDSAPLVDGLMRPPDAPALLLVASFRSEERHRSPLLRSLFRRDERLGPASTTSEIELGPLAQEDMVRLAVALITTDAADVDVSALVREAAGHPYFVHELVRQANAQGSLHGDSLTLDHMLFHRVTELPDDARRLLELISVAGHPIAQVVAQKAAELEPAAMKKAIRLLSSDHFIHTSGTRASDLVQPFHDRIRETVVRELADESLRGHHRVLGRTLAAIDSDAETLAAHFRAAGDHDIAAGYAVMAADQATETLAFEQAARLYRLAIDSTLESVSSADEDRLSTLRVKLADALANAGQGAAAAEAYLVAATAADPTRTLELQRRASLQYLRAGHIDEGLNAISEVLAGLGLRLAPTRRRALMSLLFRRFLLRIRGLRFRSRKFDLIPPDALSRIDACWSVSLGLVMVDTFQSADFATRHLLLALRAGELYRICRALPLEIGIVCTGGASARKRALEMLHLASRLADQQNEPEQIAWVDGAASLTSYQNGSFRLALQHAERASSIFRGRCTGMSWELSSTELYRIWSLFYLGEIKLLRNSADSLLEDAHARGDLYQVVSLCTGLGNIALLFSEGADEAERVLHESFRPWTRKAYHLQHFWFDMAKVHIDLYRGDLDAAYETTLKSMRELKRSLLFKIQTVRQEIVHLRARCALALALREADPSVYLRQAERDAKKLVRDNTRATVPLSLLIRAGISAIRDDRAVAEVTHERAVAAAADADMGLFATAARRQRGLLLGGDEGASLVAKADSWLTSQGIVDPVAASKTLVPGC